MKPLEFVRLSEENKFILFAFLYCFDAFIAGAVGNIKLAVSENRNRDIGKNGCIV